MKDKIRKVLEKFEPFAVLPEEIKDDIAARTAAVAEEQIFDITSNNTNKTS